MIASSIIATIFLFDYRFLKNNKYITKFTTSEFHLENSKRAIINVDGEEGSYGNMDFKVIQQGIKIIVPSKTMKQQFNKATEILEIINKNRQLTADNYSKQNTEKLGMQIWNTIQLYVQENLPIYQNWEKQNYAQRKKFISDVLNLLLDKFPSDNSRPKIYFREEAQPIWPKNIKQPAALFYSPRLSPWANDMVKTATGSTDPFFAFFHDLSGDGMLGQVTHEFTHYLQSCGKSSISYDIVEQAAEYYQYYYMDKEKNGQIYKDSIHEAEANCVGNYIRERIKQMIQLKNTIRLNNTGNNQEI